MRWHEVLLAVAGAVAAYWLRIPDAPPCAAQYAALDEERASLSSQADDLRVATAFAAAQRASREGRPPPWPAAPGDAAPAPFERAIRSAAADSGFEIVRVDCAEYPCLASFRRRDLVPGPTEPTDPGLFDAFDGALTKHGVGWDRRVFATAARPRGPEDELYGVVGLTAGRRDDEPAITASRWRDRADAMLRAFRESP